MQATKTPAYRLSLQQQRLFALGAERGRAWALALLSAEAELDEAALAHGFRQLVAHHEILRTRFEPAGSLAENAQVICDGAELLWERLDWSGQPQEAQARALAELCHGRAAAPLPPQARPALHVWLIELAARRWAVIVGLPALCADPPSLACLLAQAAALYRSTLEPPAFQYVQFAAWQDELAAEAAAGGGARRPRRNDSRASRQLLCERPDEGGTGDLSTHAWTLAPEVAAGVESLARARATTEEAVLLACLAALLHRLTLAREITIAAFRPLRYFAELRSTIGPVGSFAPLGVEVGGDLPFCELLARAGAALREIEEGQEAPVWEAAPPAPLPAFAFDYLRAAAEPGGGLDFDLVEHGVEAGLAELRLSCTRGRLGIRCALRYFSGQLSRQAAEALAGAYEAVAGAAAAAPHAPVGDLEALGREQRRALLAELDRTAGEPAPRLVHRMFELAAAGAPHAIAVSGGGEAVSYGELDARAERLAARLRRGGVGPDVVVALHLERSLPLVVAILAVLKAGGAYLPLDVTYPAARRQDLLEDSGARLLLVSRRAAGLAAAGCRVLELDDAGSATDERAADGGAGLAGNAGDGTGRCEVLPENLAYLLYTSGSTGRPKGVMVSHAGLANYLAWSAESYDLAPASRVPVHTPIGFDLTVTSLLAPLTRQGEVLLLPEEQGAAALADLLRSGAALSLLKLTPSLLQLLPQLLAPDDGWSVPEALVVGGEALHGEALSPWRRRSPAVRIWNEYGPTETVVGCCVHEVPLAAELAGAVPIGRPIAGVSLYVVNEHLRPVPAGVAGELLIGGRGVARGYRGQPAATAERFIPDPFGTMPGARLYRSGDLVIRRAGGELEYRGRIDLQVKVRGARIEPGEVEAALAAHPAVGECAVVGAADPRGDLELAAFVVARAGRRLDGDELRSFLAARLPATLVPAAIRVLDAMPLTANGKLDRAALAAAGSRPSGAPRPIVAPRTATERQLAGIWEELLEVAPIGVHDDFFALGGHSFLGLRMLARVRREIGGALPDMNQFFAAPTIEQLAQQLGRPSAAPPPPTLVALGRGAGRGAPLFLVHGQGGSARTYVELARDLGEGWPVYAFQAPGRDDEREPFATVEAMAEAYVGALREVQSVGPYRLGGWSFGGLVAFEMAQLLEQAGERVELLAILDADFAQDSEQDDASFMVEMLGPRPPVSVAELRQAADRDEMIGMAVTAARREGMLAAELELADLKRFYHFYKTTYDAAQRYRPRPYGGPVTLLLSRSWLDSKPADPTFGLGVLAARGLELMVVPVAHLDFVRGPGARLVAAALRALLARQDGAAARGKAASAAGAGAR